MPELRPKQQGLTLIELVVGIVLLGILSVAGVSMISDSFRATRLVDSGNAQDAQVRYALERLSREVREVGYDRERGYTFTDRTPSRMVFTNLSGREIWIVISGGALTINGETLLTGLTTDPKTGLTNDSAFDYYSITSQGELAAFASPSTLEIFKQQNQQLRVVRLRLTVNRDDLVGGTNMLSMETHIAPRAQ